MENNNRYLEVKGEQTGDYFKIYCSKCKDHLEIEYLGTDPSVANFKFICPKCRGTAILKIWGFKRPY
ncbi:unnamed protein product [marine sediment metagenome]|uniref:Uncharacterized protein n=1 Tax=marine sediment metagenome TaxID=412755 RepID=X1BW83_9ZZZZ